MELRQAFDPVRALGVTGRLLVAAPVTLLLGGLILVLTDAEVHTVGRVDWGDLHPRLLLPLLLGAGALCTALVLLVFNSLLQIGYAGAIQRVLVTGEERFKDLFQDRGLWLTMILARLLKWALLLCCALPFSVLAGGPVFVGELLGVRVLGVVAAAVFSLAYLPVWAYVVLGLLLVEELVAIESRSPTEAMQRSWEIAEGNRLQLLLYLIVVKVVELSGFFLCGVGVLLTKPWARAAWYESTIRLVLPEPEGGIWADRTAVAGSPDGNRT
jgi:hypothetical protein